MGKNRKKYTNVQKRALSNKDHPQEESTPFLPSQLHIDPWKENLNMRRSPLAPPRAKEQFMKNSGAKMIDIKYILSADEKIEPDALTPTEVQKDANGRLSFGESVTKMMN